VPIADSLFGRYERLGTSAGASTTHLSKLAVAQAQFRAWLGSDEAKARPWNGNVRELQSLMRSWILGFREGQKVSPPAGEPARAAESLPSPMTRFLEAQASLREVEDWYILHVLASVQYRQRKAAEILGIDRGTLARRLRLIDPVYGPNEDDE
jgi:transcriptional regulator of acetoin/glycerol metabolism